MPSEETRDTDDVAGAARAARSSEDHRTLDEVDTDGDEGHLILGDPEPEPVEPPPQPVADLASACVRFVGTRYGATLDFSHETLSFVDQWVRDARPELGRRAELMALVQSAAGAYLGEVIRRAFGGSWLVAEGDASEWKLALSTVYCTFNPIGMVRAGVRNMMACAVSGQGAGAAAAVSLQADQPFEHLDVRRVQAELRRQGARIN